MPFIHTRVNRPIPKEKEALLARELGLAIALLPGKSESWLMLQFEENCRLYFRGGADRPLAFVQVTVYGPAHPQAYEKLTARITALLQEHLGIDPDGVYVAYGETENWGWQGENF